MIISTVDLYVADFLNCCMYYMKYLFDIYSVPANDNLIVCKLWESSIYISSVKKFVEVYLSVSEITKIYGWIFVKFLKKIRLEIGEIIRVICIQILQA